MNRSLENLHCDFFTKNQNVKISESHCYRLLSDGAVKDHYNNGEYAINHIVHPVEGELFVYSDIFGQNYVIKAS
jgi:hypothetical protein